MTLSQQLQDLLDRRAGASGSPQPAWRTIVENAVHGGIPEAAVAAIAETAAGPPTLNDACRAIHRGARTSGRSPDSLWAEFIEMVDESDYTLAAWTAGIDRFFAWLRAQGRSTDWRNAAGYLHCCAMAEPGSPLPDLVEEMLRQYGFTGGDPDRPH